MKNIFGFLIILLTSCSSDDNQTAVVPEIKHIIVIGVDGMSPDGIKNSNSPNIHQMIENGSSTMHGRSVLPTTSSPNWASMIMGVGTEQHGITSNSWERDDFILPPVEEGSEKIFPTMFNLIHKNKPDSEIGVIYQWDGFGRLFEKSVVDYSFDASDEIETTEKAVAYIRDKKPLMTFIHLDHVDAAGHQFGHGTKGYYDAVSRADELIGEIIFASKWAGTYAETLFIVTADHGGINKGHGGETLAEVEIPFIMTGKGIKKNHLLTNSFVQYDHAATVAFALNIVQPSSWTGRPMKTAFEGFEENLSTSIP